MKRFISVLITLALAAALCCPALADAGLENFKKTAEYTDGRFADVPAGEWYRDNVAAAYELALIDGVSDTEFAPERNVRISEAIALAARIHSIYASGTAVFAESEPWYQSYADYCAEKGIINAGEYADMEAFATRDQFARIFAKALPASELGGKNYIEYDAIPDVEVTDTHVYTLYTAGVLGGTDEKGSFSPTANIRRCEAAAIATRMADRTLRLVFNLTRPAEPTEPDDPNAPTGELADVVKQSREAAALSQQYLSSATSILIAAGGGSMGTTEALVFASALTNAKSWAQQAASYALSASKLAEGDTAKQLSQVSTALRTAGDNMTASTLTTAQTYLNSAMASLTTVWNGLPTA